MLETLLFNAAPLASALAQGAHVVTPNRRLASRLRVAVVAEKAVAPAAPVFALADWIDQLWQQMIARMDALAAGRWVLSAAQELALWEEAVRASDSVLLRPAQAAAQAQSAYRTLALWQQLPLTAALRDECSAQTDCALFIEWLDRFERACEKKSAIASAERDRRVTEAAQRQRLQLPSKVVAVGFDDMPPLHRALLRCVSEYTEFESPARAQTAASIGFETFEKQLQAAALWAQRELQKNPAGPIAIVVPDLNQQRPIVERILLDVLTPDYALPQNPRALAPLNFSSGESLAQAPLIRSALQLLELAAPAIERDTLLQWLGSPFHSYDDEKKLADLIAAICSLRSEPVRAAQLRVCAETIAERDKPWMLSQALQQLADRVRRERWHSAKYSAQQWTQKFADVLTLFGWPGQRTLDSIEYQQHMHWQQMLIEFARYDQVCAPFDFSTALQRLRQFAQAQVFQAQTRDTPLQILGVLEAAGLQFAALWLCDMSDDRWPAAATQQPLLPRALQRRLRMPRCDADREYGIAQRLTRSLLASAPHVVVSYQNESNDVARKISPLFSSLPEISCEKLLGAEIDELLPATGRRRSHNAAFFLEEFSPGSAPALTPAEIIRGGSALFKDQAACPFRAFIAHRLNAYPLDEPAVGLDAAERGSILHVALEFIWRALQTQSALLALDQNAQDELIANAAAAALQDFTERHPLRIGLRFIALEKQRLARVLNAWLAVERERGEFVVHALEQEHRATFGGLPLRLRVDRIDRLRDGRFLIIDYKTKQANCSINEWLGDRPDEPQLPLYAQTFENNDTLGGVAFAQVRLEKPQLVATGAIEQPQFSLPNRFDDEKNIQSWEELQSAWRTALENLARQFSEGCAFVDPKARNTCDFCAFESICRHHHETAADSDAIVVEGDAIADEGD